MKEREREREREREKGTNQYEMNKENNTEKRCRGNEVTEARVKQKEYKEQVRKPSFLRKSKNTEGILNTFYDRKKKNEIK